MTSKACDFLMILAIAEMVLLVRKMNGSLSLTRIIPALIHIQAHLDQDLTLDRLADESELSKYHFHKLFHKATGETPKSYVDRLRLERAAIQLRIRRAT